MAPRQNTGIATSFKTRGVASSDAHYEQIIASVSQGIDRHMGIDHPRRMALYFHHCLQAHMRHQGDNYDRRVWKVE